MERYTVKLELFVWSDSEQEAIETARAIQDKQRQKWDNRCTVTTIEESPFGRLGQDNKVFDIQKDNQL
jgi:hypothetical protein